MANIQFQLSLTPLSSGSNHRRCPCSLLPHATFPKSTPQPQGEGSNKKPKALCSISSGSGSEHSQAAFSLPNKWNVWHKSICFLATLFNPHFKGKLKLHKVRKRLVEHFSIWWKADRVPSSFCSLSFPSYADICFIKAAIEMNLLIKNLSHLTTEQREISNDIGCSNHL